MTQASLKYFNPGGIRVSKPDRQCLVCNEAKDIFSFNLTGVDVCHGCTFKLQREAIKPHYPVPATEFVNALSMPYEAVSPYVKVMLLERE